MTGFYCFVFYLFFLTLCKEASSLPFANSDDGAMTRPLHMFIPKMDYPRLRREEEGRAEGQAEEGRAEEGEQSGASGIQQFLTTAIKDGIAASSAMDSPTMFIGGFSVMMQPMPNGTEFAGQLMQMAPHYLSLLPSLPSLPSLPGEQSKN